MPSEMVTAYMCCVTDCQHCYLTSAVRPVPGRRSGDSPHAAPRSASVSPPRRSATQLNTTATAPHHHQQHHPHHQSDNARNAASNSNSGRRSFASSLELAAITGGGGGGQDLDSRMQGGYDGAADVEDFDPLASGPSGVSVPASARPAGAVGLTASARETQSQRAALRALHRRREQQQQQLVTAAAAAAAVRQRVRGYSVVRDEGAPGGANTRVVTFDV